MPSRFSSTRATRSVASLAVSAGPHRMAACGSRPQRENTVSFGRAAGRARRLQIRRDYYCALIIPERLAAQSSRLIDRARTTPAGRRCPHRPTPAAATILSVTRFAGRHYCGCQPLRSDSAPRCVKVRRPPYRLAKRVFRKEVTRRLAGDPDGAGTDGLWPTGNGQ